MRSLKLSEMASASTVARWAHGTGPPHRPLLAVDLVGHDALVHVSRRELLEVVQDRLEGHPAAVEHAHLIGLEVDGRDVEAVSPSVDVDLRMAPIDQTRQVGPRVTTPARLPATRLLRLLLRH